MNDLRLFDGLGSALQQVLDLRSTQHGLISANLANADTPGYRAKEIPFGELLDKVVRAAEDHDASAQDDDIPVQDRDPLAWAVDGNSVNAETEAAKLTENSLMYAAVSTGMSKRLAMLRFAASDGKA
jgi:flagellar basal-body rod protein FlgB